jgi:hypothetical protein
MIDLEGKGSYKDSKGISHEFSVFYLGFERSEEGLDEATLPANYGFEGVVDIVNEKRGTKAVNAERVALTADQRKEKDNKASVYDQVQAAQTDEEKMAILRSNGLLS